jgi:hypothetical protein
MVRPTDREDAEYRQGIADATRTSDSNGLLGVLIGAVVVLGLGVAAYFVFAGQPQKSDSPNIINVPAPQAPAPQAPSVKIEVPKSDTTTNSAPSLSVPSPGTSTSGGN